MAGEEEEVDEDVGGANVVVVGDDEGEGDVADR